MKDNIYKIYPITSVIYDIKNNSRVISEENKFETFYEPDEGLNKELDYFLEEYSLDSDLLFSNLSSSMNNQNFNPWCFIFFKKEYDIFNKIDEVRNKTEILCGSYSILSQKDLEQKKKTVSIIIVKSKNILMDLSNKSTIFQHLWMKTKELPSYGIYGIISDSPI